jgi:hypothetical protein
MDAPQVIVVGGGRHRRGRALVTLLRGLARDPAGRGEPTSGTTGPPRAAALGRPLRGQRQSRRSSASPKPHPAPHRRVLRGERWAVRRPHRRGHGLPAQLLAGCAALASRPGRPRPRPWPWAGLNPALKAAVWVPDAAMDDAAAAAVLRHRTAGQRPAATVHRVTGHAGRRSPGWRSAPDRSRGRTPTPLCERHRPLVRASGAMAGAAVPVQPSPGVLWRWRPAVQSGRQPPPRRRRQRHRPAPAGLSIVGTAWTVEDPDDLDVPDERRAMRGRQAGPGRGLGQGGPPGRRRPLSRRLRRRAAAAGCPGPSSASTTPSPTGLGSSSITGGKATTLRPMAEATADLVCASSASRPPAAPVTPCWLPPPPPGGRHEHSRTVLLRSAHRPGRPVPRYDEFGCRSGRAPCWTPCWPSADSRTGRPGTRVCTAPAAPAGCGSTAAKSWPV